MITVVKILINGEMNESIINEKKNLYEELEDISNYKGYDKIDFLYEWNYDNNYIRIYGWTDGDINNKNTHSLPHNGNDIKSLNIDSDEITLYGDIIIIKTDKDNKLYDIYSEEYGEFYNVIYNYKDSESDSTDTDIEDEYNTDDSDNSLDYETYDDVKSDIKKETLKKKKEDVAISTTTLKKLKSKKKIPIKYMGNILNMDTNMYAEFK